MRYQTLSLYYHTIRHLTARQLIFQVWNRLRGRPWLNGPADVPDNVSRSAFPITFAFLNQTVTFETAIDWNYAANGKLWTYNLTYFEFLAHTPEAQGLALIYDFIRQTPRLIDGVEPYPISLRVLNWRQFLRKNGVHDPLIEAHLYAQTALLRSRLEYHLGANHLLENACALTIMAVHFQQRAWYQKATRLLRAELTEQILADGGHYERSPVYHQLLTDRLLDVYETLHETTWDTLDPDLITLVRDTLTRMLGWLQAVTFRNSDVPMVNDAANGVAPTTDQLVEKATRLNLISERTLLTDSGYRMLATPRFECFADVGPVGPDYQPGHAHADTLSFVLYADGQPAIVDPGTSTYQPGVRRDWERSTAAHNTVTIGGRNSSEVWGGFRVGRRAAVEVLTDTDRVLSARHTGYGHTVGSYHTRTWRILDERTLQIDDVLTGEATTGEVRFYLNNPGPLRCTEMVIETNGLRLQFKSMLNFTISSDTYERATAFNQYLSCCYILVTFKERISTLVVII